MKQSNITAEYLVQQNAYITQAERARENMNSRISKWADDKCPTENANTLPGNPRFHDMPRVDFTHPDEPPLISLELIRAMVIAAIVMCGSAMAVLLTLYAFS